MAGFTVIRVNPPNTAVVAGEINFRTLTSHDEPPEDWPVASERLLWRDDPDHRLAYPEGARYNPASAAQLIGESQLSAGAATFADPPAEAAPEAEGPTYSAVAPAPRRRAAP